MKFDEFDKKMRKFEESLDQFIPTDFFMVARLDGKGFTKLTKTEMELEKPFDIRFRDAIINTIKYLMNGQFQIIYAYNESDEISLLFQHHTDKFKRKVRKYNSILAAETSVHFSRQIGNKAIFDCRIIPLPNLDAVQDYFAWRQADSNRNAILAHCYYKLVASGKTPPQAAAYLQNLPFRDKIKLLAHFGKDLHSIPKWQLYGIAVYWQETAKSGFNPVKNTHEQSIRKKLTESYDLPTGNEYRNFIARIIACPLTGGN